MMNEQISNISEQEEAKPVQLHCALCDDCLEDSETLDQDEAHLCQICYRKQGFAEALDFIQTF